MRCSVQQGRTVYLFLIPMVGGSPWGVVAGACAPEQDSAHQAMASKTLDRRDGETHCGSEARSLL